MTDGPESKRNLMKRARFLKVAERRTRNTLRCIRLLAKCSNRSSYQYTSSEVEKIFHALQDAMERARMGFNRDKPVKFSLSREEVGEDLVDSEEEV